MERELHLVSFVMIEMRMGEGTTATQRELDRALDAVVALSEVLEEDARFNEEMELRISLFLAEASGEVVTSAPPPWQQAA